MLGTCAMARQHGPEQKDPCKASLFLSVAGVIGLPQSQLCPATFNDKDKLDGLHQLQSTALALLTILGADEAAWP